MVSHFPICQVNKGEPFVRKVLSRAEALKLFKDNDYKTEIINELPEDAEISVYYTGNDFYDLCSGPHVESARNLQNYAFKIHAVNGAYWRGNEKKNPSSIAGPIVSFVVG